MLSSICANFCGLSNCRYYAEDNGSVEEIPEHGHRDQTISDENLKLIEHDYIEEKSPVDPEMEIISKGALLESVLLTVQEEESNPIFANMLHLHLVNKALNKNLKEKYLNSLQYETNHKIGLYGKNLILEGLKLYDEEFQARIKLKYIQEHKKIHNIDMNQRSEFLDKKKQLEASLKTINKNIQKHSKQVFKYQKNQQPKLDIDSQQTFDIAVAHLENPSPKSSEKLKKTIEKLKSAIKITFDAANFVYFF